jgi:L-threonine kinase
MTATLHRKKFAIGYANGTFGELIQGPLGSAENLNLVTLPVDRHSSATFIPDFDSCEIRVDPLTKTKSQRLATEILRAQGYQYGGRLRIDSELMEGKGMASSSADLVATARAIEDFLGKPLINGALEELLRNIEPTDGVMHAGVVSYFHLRVQKNVDFGEMFDCRIFFLDDGGSIDTIAYNKNLLPYSEVEVRQYTQLHGELQGAFRRRDRRAVGEIATKSAYMNQRRNPKRSLDEVREISRRCGAMGVVVTHSGPCIGILVSKDEPHFTTVCRKVERELSDLPGALGVVDTLRGGGSVVNSCRSLTGTVTPPSAQATGA